MDSNLDHRPYRKNLKVHGLIYIGEETLDITVRNLSITGLLAELNSEDNNGLDIKTLFTRLLTITTFDLYLPNLRLAGEVDVVRMDMENGCILLAMEFKQVAYDVDRRLCKRGAHRKNMAVPGEILLDKVRYDFNTINVSIDGLMIQLDKNVIVEEGLITVFKFKRLGLAGKVRVVWVDYTAEAGTLLGLKYVNVKKSEIKKSENLPSSAKTNAPKS
jgi:hypothetical protein